MLSQLLTAILGLMVLWSMGFSVQYDQQKRIRDRLDTALWIHEAVAASGDVVCESTRYAPDLYPENGIALEDGAAGPGGDDADHSPPLVPFIVYLGAGLVVCVSADAQRYGTFVDHFKRRWRLLFAPARSPPFHRGLPLAAMG